MQPMMHPQSFPQEFVYMSQPVVSSVSSSPHHNTATRGLPLSSATLAYTDSASGQVAQGDAMKGKDVSACSDQSSSDATHEYDVGILGAGWFGRALSKRLVKSGKTVVLASRNPERFSSAESFAVQCKVLSLEKVIEASKLLVLALPEKAHEQFALNYGRQLPAGITLVDVCNTEKPGAAIRLAKMLPHVKVVKALNTISAYALEGSVQVHSPICLSGEAGPKKQVIESLIQPLGLSPFDMGSLESSTTQEEMPMKFFGIWRLALIITSLVFTAWLIYCVLWYHVYDLPEQFPGDPAGNKPIFKAKQFPLNTMNKVLALTGFTLLALTYLPGTLAGVLQLVRGTTKVPFPALLANWMNVRKQLGLTSFWIITQHMIMSCLLTSKEYYWYPLYMHDPNNYAGAYGETDHMMTVYGETALLLAVMAYSLFLIIALTSIPSIAATMSWKEWTFVHSTLGGLTLAVAFAHVFVYCSAYTTCVWCKDWGVFEFYPNHSAPPSWVAIGIPGLTILLRLFLLLPGVSHRLAKIRSQ